jgi:hypothetical protein
LSNAPQQTCEPGQSVRSSQWIASPSTHEPSPSAEHVAATPPSPRLRVRQQICELGVQYASGALGAAQKIPGLFHAPPELPLDPPELELDDEDEEEEEEEPPDELDELEPPPELLDAPPELEEPEAPDEAPPEEPAELPEDPLDPVGSLPKVDEPSGSNSSVSAAPLHAATAATTKAEENVTRAARYIALESFIRGRARVQRRSRIHHVSLRGEARERDGRRGPRVWALVRTPPFRRRLRMLRRPALHAPGDAAPPS